MSETVALSPEPQSTTLPGLLIAGKYRIEAEIGRGSMGTVYRAVHVTLGQHVAIKLISSEHSQSMEMRRRFSVEAKAAAKLRSRHVVQVIDDGETPEGNPYIVLELLEGETLEQRLAREHDVPLADAVRVVVHVGRALARAHAQGIVHRDLKPANVFLVKSDDDEAGWVAKVLDFGIAKVAQQASTTQTGTVLGTPLFMSPEQVRGASSVDHRADLYSLGMCLFHMLTGEHAFYSESYSELLVAICTRPPPLLREKAPWLPVPLESWFQRACAKAPIDRFQSADEMTEALLAAAGGASPVSKHESVPEGRIAPETLVGFVPPILTAPLQPEQPDQPERGALSQTQRLEPPARAEPPVTPIAVSVARDRPSSNVDDWLPRRRNFRPLVVGVGLGLLVLATLAVAFQVLSRRTSQPVAAPTPSARPTDSTSLASPVPRPAERSLSSSPIPAEAPSPPATALSSVTAEAAPALAAPELSASGPRPQKPARGAIGLGLGGNAAAPARRSSSTSRPPAEPRDQPAGSDLGF